MKSAREIAARHIGERLRNLRTSRGWSQAELARRLDLSQSRLSGVERGLVSLTAEEFLDALRLFNVPATDFVRQPRAGASQLQNALERLGATHLRENPDILPSETFKEAGSVIREVLTSAEAPRHITALAPVLVTNADRINFTGLGAQLYELGLRDRLGWLLENTIEAAKRELERPMSRLNRVSYRRAIVVLEQALGTPKAATGVAANRTGGMDLLDRGVSSGKTFRELIDSTSAISRGWNIATAIQVDDFVAALKASRVGD